MNYIKFLNNYEIEVSTFTVGAAELNPNLLGWVCCIVDRHYMKVYSSYMPEDTYDTREEAQEVGIKVGLKMLRQRKEVEGAIREKKYCCGGNY